MQEEQKSLGVSCDSQSVLISSSAKKKKYVEPKCFQCGQIGHICRNCIRASANQKEQAESSGKLTHNAKTANEHDPKELLSTEEADSVFAASSSSQSEIVKWLLDSGASRSANWYTKNFNIPKRLDWAMVEQSMLLVMVKVYFM